MRSMTTSNSNSSNTETTMDTQSTPKRRRIRRSRPARTAYVAVIYDGGIRLGIAREGEGGYYKVKKHSDLYPAFEDYAKAQECARVANERLGLSAEDVADIVCSTMRKP